MERLEKEELLELLNEKLYEFITLTSKNEEKSKTKEIKAIIRILKVYYKKKVKFDKESMLFIFK